MLSKDARIAVLGSGPMGMAVAYELVRQGYRPVVFEADDRVGGMTASFDFDGLTIERYYHFHCTSDHAAFEVLRELGLSDKLHWVATRMGYWFQNRLQPWGNPGALLGFQGLGWVAKFRYALHAFLATKRNHWQPLDGENAIAWIQRWVGAEAYEVLWRKLFELKFYDHADHLSAAWIWSRIRRIGRSRYSLFKEQLGYLEGGSSTLLNAMADHVRAHGGQIRLSTPVQRVVLQGDRVQGVETPVGFETFDRVISTVPLPYVPRLIPDLPADLLQRYQAVGNIAVVCVIAKLKRALTDNFWLNVNDPEMDIPGLVEYTNLRPLDQHIVYVPFYMPGEHPKYQDADAVFEQKVRRYLGRINPALQPDDVLAVHVHRYRYAQPICGPRFAQQLPPRRLPIEGLWVADTSYYYPEDRGIAESIAFGRSMAREAVQ